VRTDSAAASANATANRRVVDRGLGIRRRLLSAQRFTDVKQPVFIRDNVYAAGAKPYEAETRATVLTGTDVTVAIADEGAEVYLECQLPAAFDNVRVDTVRGADLEHVRFVDAFEGPDSTPIVLDADLIGAYKTLTSSHPAGPITTLTSGNTRTRVW